MLKKDARNAAVSDFGFELMRRHGLCGELRSNSPDVECSPKLSAVERLVLTQRRSGLRLSEVEVLGSGALDR